ncbi:MAG: class F sortase [Candidatus Paceibacterota bacterium]|jgi:LPXTG-site transpeptidase (sortase) family protein
MNLSKISSKWLVVIIVGIIFSAIVISFLTFSLPVKDSFAEASFVKTQSVLSAKADLEYSFRLKIPKINVDATVENLGLTFDGAMEVPKGPANAAWYSLGTPPGDIGSSVIDGHSGWKNGIPAVFDNLYKLKKGDKIYVQDKKGIVTTFVVRESRKYNPNADATGVFTSSDGKAHLNLITCTGLWNKIWKSHSERLVVFADKELK